MVYHNTVRRRGGVVVTSEPRSCETWNFNNSAEEFSTAHQRCTGDFFFLGIVIIFVVVCHNIIVVVVAFVAPLGAADGLEPAVIYMHIIIISYAHADFLVIS